MKKAFMLQNSDYFPFLSTEKEYKRKKIARLVMIIAFFMFGMCIILVGGTLAMSKDIDKQGQFTTKTKIPL